MIEFNSYNIFTGEIKQLLADFNLPKYSGGKWLKTDTPTYTFGQHIRNYTRNLQIKSNAYDSYTHEYLGWFLRFIRDYKNIDLMPLYNCFSNNVCQNIYLDAGNVLLDSSDAHYKIYSFPIILGQKYTIAIDCDSKIEMCCALYSKYLNDAQFGIPFASSKIYHTINFNFPEIYDTSNLLNIQGISAYENDLRLFIKVPIANTSSIVVLEGDYSHWNDAILHQVSKITKNNNSAQVWETASNHWVTNLSNEELDIYAAEYNSRFEHYETFLKESVIPQEAAVKNFKPITSLQLLRINSGVSHPFADRLIEYLTKNAITSDDDIADNIERTQRVMSYEKITDANTNRASNITFTDWGVWEDKIRPMLYNSMQSSHCNKNNINHDILGYVDKDVETYYNTVDSRIISNDNYLKDSESQSLVDINSYLLITKDNVKVYNTIHAINNENIYSDLYTK